VNQLLNRWLEVLDVEPSTRLGCVRKADKHIRPLLGTIQVGRVDAELLETFYARLRKCRGCTSSIEPAESTTAMIAASRMSARAWRTLTLVGLGQVA
jgi:hypothetical protein